MDPRMDPKTGCFLTGTMFDTGRAWGINRCRGSLGSVTSVTGDTDLFLLIAVAIPKAWYTVRVWTEQRPG